MVRSKPEDLAVYRSRTMPYETSRKHEYRERREEFFVFALLIAGDIAAEHNSDAQAQRAVEGRLFWQVFERFFGEDTWDTGVVTCAGEDPMRDYIAWCEEHRAKT